MKNETVIGWMVAGTPVFSALAAPPANSKRSGSEARRIR